MKRVYQKPVILMENLSITEMIAAGCDITFIKKEDCALGGYADPILDGIFTELMGCEIDISLGGSYEGNDNICYHTSAEGGTVFNS